MNRGNLPAPRSTHLPNQLANPPGSVRCRSYIRSRDSLANTDVITVPIARPRAAPHAVEKQIDEAVGTA